RVHRDTAVQARQPDQPHGLGRGAQRRDALRRRGRVQLPEDEAGGRSPAGRGAHRSERAAVRPALAVEPAGLPRAARLADRDSRRPRSEEHTSELQSRGHLVCRLLLEKKKKTTKEHGREMKTAWVTVRYGIVPT